MAPDVGVVARFSDVESRIGIQPLEELLAERDELVKRIAPLQARHGFGGTYGDLRKIHLSQIAALIRAEAASKNVKMTEAAIDEAAHAHARYVDFVIRATTEKAEHMELENRIQNITDRIVRNNVIGRYVTNEVALER